MIGKKVAPRKKIERNGLNGAGNKGERTRQRIKQAFEELLEQKSFASITIADICGKSEITVGGLYFHFASQDEILNEVMWEYADGLWRGLDGALDRAATGHIASAVCGALVNAYKERNGLARTFQQLTRTRSDYSARWRAASEPRVARIARLLEHERPDLKAEKARFLAHALLTMVISQLDLAFVYRERSRHQNASVTITARNLEAIWDRMAAVRSHSA